MSITPPETAPADPYGPHKTIISSIYELSPEALEQLAMWIEQRGIHTPISNVVGYPTLTPHTISGSGGGAALGTTVAAAFANIPGGGGDVISNLRPGSYMFAFTSRVKVDVNTNTGVLGLQINGVDPGGAAAGDPQHFLFNNTDPVTETQVCYVTLKGDLSTVRLRWLVTGGTATMYEFTIAYLKIGN